MESLGAGAGGTSGAIVAAVSLTTWRVSPRYAAGTGVGGRS